MTHEQVYTHAHNAYVCTHIATHTPVKESYIPMHSSIIYPYVCVNVCASTSVYICVHLSIYAQMHT